MARKELLETVLREHGVMLRRIAGSYEANPAKRQELQQDILAAIWRALPAFRGESSVRTFVARIARNRAINHVAKAAGEPRGMPLEENWPSNLPSPFEEAVRHEQQRKLMDAVRTLPLAMREPVLLTLEGFTPREIASILGISASIISIRLTRAKERLRAELQ